MGGGVWDYSILVRGTSGIYKIYIIQKYDLRVASGIYKNYINQKFICSNYSYILEYKNIHYKDQTKYADFVL